MKKLIVLSLAILLFACGKRVDNSQAIANGEGISLYSQNFDLTDLTGKSFDLQALKGKKLIIVNTASKCGLTSQYEQLEAIYQKYKDKGLVIIGFPANDFLSQEPGSDKEIASFCKQNYGVSFPMMSKISVKGDDTHPIYQFLTQKAKNGISDNSVAWNFQKYLIDVNGYIQHIIPPKTAPDSPEIIDWITK